MPHSPSQVPQLPWITFLNLVSGIIIFWVVNIKRRQCWTVAQVFAHYTARRHLSPQYNRVALLDFPSGTVDGCKYYAPLPGGIIINTLYEQMHSAQCRCTGKIVTLWFCAPWHGWLVWVGDILATQPQWHTLIRLFHADNTPCYFLPTSSLAATMLCLFD